MPPTWLVTGEANKPWPVLLRSICQNQRGIDWLGGPFVSTARCEGDPSCLAGWITRTAKDCGLCVQHVMAEPYEFPRVCDNKIRILIPDLPGAEFERILGSVLDFLGNPDDKPARNVVNLLCGVLPQEVETLIRFLVRNQSLYVQVEPA